MGLYTRKTYPGDTCVSPGFVVDQLTALNTALGTGRDYFIGVLHKEAASAGVVAVGTVQDVLVVPIACTLVGVKVMAGAISTGGDVDVYNQTGTPATVLSGVVSVSAANTDYAGTIASGAIAAGDILTLRMAIGGGNSMTNVSVALLFKATLVDGVSVPGTPSGTYMDSATYKSIMEDIETGFDNTTDYYLVQLEKVAATGQPVANTAIQDSVICPYAGTIAYVSYVCNNWTTGTTTTVDLWNQTGTPATVLSAAMAVTGDLTKVDGTVALPTVAADDVLTMRYVVNGGSSTLDMGKMTVLIKKTLSTS